MRSDLVLDALLQALQTRSASGAIFHSDRGSQYGSTPFRNALAQAGLRQSMSARANPYDNAWTESFIGTLKARNASRRLLRERRRRPRPRSSITLKVTTTPTANTRPSATKPRASSRPTSTQQTKTQTVQKSVAPQSGAITAWSKTVHEAPVSSKKSTTIGTGTVRPAAVIAWPLGALTPTNSLIMGPYGTANRIDLNRQVWHGVRGRVKKFTGSIARILFTKNGSNFFFSYPMARASS